MTHKTIRVYLLLFLALLAQIPGLSQENTPPVFGKVSPQDFDLSRSHLVDSNTNAVIIADVGNTYFIGNKINNWVSYVFKEYMRIKIINQQAFDLATIRVLLRGTGKTADQLDSLQATTYNLENGKVVATRLSLNDVFRDTLSKSRVETKFTFPQLKAGCIIEYSYTKTSFRYWNLPFWNFQHEDYPCLYNKYVTAIPNMLGYLTLQHGQDSFLVNKIEKTREQYKMYSVNVTAEVTKHTWIMKDIPPFRAEPFLVHPYNYMDEIEFNLLQTYNGEDISGHIDWKSTTKELLESDEFGEAIALESTTSLTNAVERISSADVDYTVAANHIYDYIRDNFDCIPDNEISLTNNLYTVNKKKKGSVADLNLLLIAMLRQKHINASPVILSTSTYGTNPASYPVLSKMNYVICMMKMAGDTTWLDASDPLLGFGKLPLSCYNGHARIISDHDSGSVFFRRDNIREQNTTTLFIVNDEKVRGKMTGTAENSPGSFESHDIRAEVKKKGEKPFFKNIQDALGPDITLENPGIDSLKRLEDPVKVHYDFSLTPEDNQGVIYFNPILQWSYKETPFKASDRKYPVEIAYPIDKTYSLNMEIPEGYTVDELPKSVKVAYNGSDGSFEYLIQKSETSVQLRTRIKLSRTFIPAEDYNSLRDFFAYIVKKLSEQIVFKKKK
jgi:hypothetical protein